MSSAFQTANGLVFVTHMPPQQMGYVVPAPHVTPNVSSVLGKFLKGEPKVLGTIQIIIGVIMILFGIVMAFYIDTVGVVSGIVFWGALFYIISGALTVAAETRLNKCLVKGALGMNIISTIAAGSAIVLHCLDLVNYNCYGYDCSYISWYTIRSLGISGVLLVFAFMEFIVSICVSAFACKAMCGSTLEPVGVGVMQNPQAEVNNVLSGHLPNPNLNPNLILTSNTAKISNQTEHCEMH